MLSVRSVASFEADPMLSVRTTGAWQLPVTKYLSYLVHDYEPALGLLCSVSAMGVCGHTHTPLQYFVHDNMSYERACNLSVRPTLSSLEHMLLI